MIVTVSDFQRITGISRHTVYSWIYRNKMPKGLGVAGVGKSKILEVKKDYEHFTDIKKALS